MQQVIKPKNRAEWLSHRVGGIGSSEVATILGLNPYETRYQLWRRKTGRDTAIEENEAMKMGHLLEPVVAKKYAEETGNHVIKASAGDWIIFDDAAPHRRVSPDRLFWRKGDKHNQQNRGILECKTTMMHIDRDDLPKHWFTQLQYQMGVAGISHGALAWLVGGRDFGCAPMAFVPSYFEWICAEVDKFWAECIEGDSEPALINPADVLKKYYQHTEGKVVEADDDIYSDALEILNLKAQKKALEEQLAEVEGRVKMAMQDAEVLMYQGKKLATWRTSRPSQKLDTKSLCADVPAEVLERHMKEVPGTRRFLIS